MTKRIDESNASGVRAAMDLIATLNETIKPYVGKLDKMWQVLDCHEQVAFETEDYDEATDYLKKNWDDLSTATKVEEPVSEAGEYDFRENPASDKGEEYKAKADMPGYGRGTAKVRYVPAKSGDNALAEEKSFKDYVAEADAIRPYGVDSSES